MWLTIDFMKVVERRRLYDIKNCDDLCIHASAITSAERNDEAELTLSFKAVCEKYLKSFNSRRVRRQKRLRRVEYRSSDSDSVASELTYARTEELS